MHGKKNKLFGEAAMIEADNRLGLPPRVPLAYFFGDGTGWPNHYGGIETLAKYCRLIPRLSPGFNATWQHGVNFPWIYSRNPGDILLNVRLDFNRLVLVANEDQKMCLNAAGYSNVHAIGLPWAYAKPSTLSSRISGSVLLMPPHTLLNAPFDRLDQISDYCNYACSKYKGESSLLYACLHMSCITNDQYPQLFREYGIKLLTGADSNDRNSLIRMWKIFSQFETVSTPAVGSHVYYALSAGCNVVIEGPKIDYSVDQVMKDASFRRSLKAGLDPVFDQAVLEGQKKFERMFDHPRSDLVMGSMAVGMNCRKSPEEIRHLLRWSKRGQVRLAVSSKVNSLKRKASKIIGSSVDLSPGDL